MSSMRSRLALLVATAVLLTPGWNENGPAESPQQSELAAIVLAAPAEKGVIRESTTDMEHRLGARQGKRSSNIISLAILASGLAAFLFLSLEIVFSRRGTLAHLFQLRAQFIRGPPPLHAA
jgi:hypothetical protein